MCGTTSSCRTFPSCKSASSRIHVGTSDKNVDRTASLAVPPSWSAITTSEFVKGASEETAIVRWTFKDGTVLEVKQEEHSVRTLRPECPVAPAEKTSSSDVVCPFLPRPADDQPLHHLLGHHLPAQPGVHLGAQQDSMLRRDERGA